MARIVFDLDGTLIDSAPDLCGIANALMAKEGLAPITLEQARDFIGKGVAVFVAQLRGARGIPDSEQDRLIKAFQAQYQQAVALTLPYPGVVEALRALQARGHRLGICTNKPIKPCLAVLKHLALDEFFESIWGGDSLPQHKPDPAPLHAAFAALGAGEKIYVGDSEVDAQTAQNAKIPFVLFTEGYRKTRVADMSHDARFSHFSDLEKLVGGLLSEPVA